MTASIDADQNAVLLHQLRNKLSIIVGFCDLLLSDLSVADPKKAEVNEIRSAGLAALALLPELSSRMK
jgi:hypothetical protein